MIFVDEYKVQICGTPELNLAEGIVLMRALVDTNPKLKSKEAREKYFKDVMKIAEDDDLEAFLFSLGCYSGEPITVISHIKGGCVVSIKDARYNIDTDLARAISI